MTRREKLQVLLLDGDTRQCLPVARALRDLGHRVHVLCTKRVSYGSWSKYPHSRHYGPSPSDDPSGFLEYLVALLRSHRFDVTIPLFDHSATVVSREKTLLTQYTRIPIPDHEVFMLARNKLRTMDLCNGHGIPHPRTYDPESIELSRLQELLSYPCLVKPNIGSGAEGIRMVERRGDLPSALDHVSRFHGPCHVQEFVPQSGTQYKAQVFRSSSGEILACVIFTKLRYYPVSGGTSSLNATVYRPDIEETCRRLVTALGWSSHADVDLIEDPRDGIVKVMEVNPRVTGSIKLAFEAGVNFSDLLVHEAMGWELAGYRDYERGLVMRYMPLDILWFLGSPDRWKAKPSWFSFFGPNICYQEGSLRDPLPILAGFISGLSKYIDRRRESAGNE